MGQYREMAFDRRFIGAAYITLDFATAAYNRTLSALHVNASNNDHVYNCFMIKEDFLVIFRIKLIFLSQWRLRQNYS
jgi:hypothetical protein